MAQIIKLTENDLHNIIGNVVNRILKENIVNMDCVEDIINAKKIDDVTVKFINSTYEECELNVIGQSGEEYIVYLTISGQYDEGAKSYDYDVPDDDPETSYNIDNIEIEKYNEETNDYIPIKLDSTPSALIDALMNHIHVDWSEYSPYNDFYEE